MLRSVAAVAACGAAGTLLWQWFGSEGELEANYAGIRCSRVRALAAAYLRGELAQAQQQQIKLHVAQCERCRQLLQSMGARS
ncbi:MAG: zf-HC2 domain-containing protein [Pirellulales bacterium]|nr:zf-HC2 domain-containing protein [Pirellulales bacterium]